MANQPDVGKLNDISGLVAVVTGGRYTGIDSETYLTAQRQAVLDLVLS